MSIFNSLGMFKGRRRPTGGAFPLGMFSADKGRSRDQSFKNASAHLAAKAHAAGVVDDVYDFVAVPLEAGMVTLDADMSQLIRG